MKYIIISFRQASGLAQVLEGFWKDLWRFLVGIDVFFYATFASSLVVFRSGPLHLPFELTVTVTHIVEELLTRVGLQFLDIFNFLPGWTPRFVV